MHTVAEDEDKSVALAKDDTHIAAKDKTTSIVAPTHRDSDSEILGRWTTVVRRQSKLHRGIAIILYKLEDMRDNMKL